MQKYLLNPALYLLRWKKLVSLSVGSAIFGKISTAGIE